jgi:hypothetical protein
MLLEEKKKLKIGVGVGIPLMVAGRLLTLTSTPEDLRDNPLFLMIGLVGCSFYLWGCWNFAKGKGWHGWFGLFLGLIFIIGLVVLFVLPDKTKEPKPPVLPNV